MFRSLWGLPASSSSTELESRFQRIALQFSGVECSLLDINYPDTDGFFAALKSSKLKWICGVYTGWDDYVKGNWRRMTVEQVRYFISNSYVITMVSIILKAHQSVSRAIGGYPKASDSTRPYQFS